METLIKLINRINPSFDQSFNQSTDNQYITFKYTSVNLFIGRSKTIRTMMKLKELENQRLDLQCQVREKVELSLLY